jgi:hypothetical protein
MPTLWEIFAAFAWGPCAIILLVITLRAPYCLWQWFSMKGVYLRARTAELEKIIKNNR